MACIKTLTKAITYDCQPGAVGIAEMYLINFDDVVSTTLDNNNSLTAISLRSGAKTVPVDCYKNGAKFIEALKLTDVSAGLDQSVTFTIYDKKAGAINLIVPSLLSGRFMAAIRFKDISSIKRLIGCRCGLEISQADTDSSANGGFVTVTLKTPDDARGENVLPITDSAWATIVNAKLV